MSPGIARLLLRAFASTCAVLLGGCGNGGSTTPALTTAADSSHATALVHLSFVVPKKTSSSATRSAKYVSISTNSLTITVTPAGGTAQTPIYVGCSSLCAASFQAPVGRDSIALTLTDGPNGTGHQLSLSTTTVTVVPNAANTFNLTADPVVSSVAILLGAVPAATASTNGGTATDVPLTVNAMDADGNTIVGPGSYVDANGVPVTLTLSVSNVQAGGNGTVALSQSSFTAPPSSAVTAHYDGDWLDHAVISVNTSSAAITSLTSATLSTIPYAVEYAVPTAGAGPSRITTGPDGALWFSEYTANRIGRTTTQGSVTEFSMGITGANPNYIVTGPDNNLWYTYANSASFARITPGGTVTEFPLPANASQIITAPDGHLWLAVNGAQQIGYATVAGAFTGFPANFSSPAGIGAGPGGSLWVSYDGASELAKFSYTGVETDYAYVDPNPTRYTDSLAFPADGNIWFPSDSGYYIERSTPSGALTRFSVGITNNAGIQNVVVGPDGNVWFAETNANMLGRITLSGTVQEFGSANGLSGIGDLTTGPDGNVWFTDYVTNSVGKFVI